VAVRVARPLRSLRRLLLLLLLLSRLAAGNNEAKRRCASYIARLDSFGGKRRGEERRAGLDFAARRKL